MVAVHGSPGCRAERAARSTADRQNLIRVMPAQGGDLSQRQDVIVVGGGVIGLASAWRLAQRGLSVAVLERGEPGGGATRAAAGMLAPVTESEFGDEPVLQSRLAAAEAWPRFASELAEASGLDCGYRRNGCLSIALDADDLGEVSRHHEFRLELGLAAEWLLASACRELESALSTSTAGGSFTPDDGEVDPRRLTAALVGALEGAGVPIVRANVGSLEEVFERAPTVVAATGAWAEWLPEEARPPVRPVKGQILRLRGRRDDPVVERTIRTPEVYVVPRASGEVVVGATVEERGFDTTVTAGAVHELLRAAYRALPELAELEFVEASAGLRPGTPDNLPIVERTAVEGLVLATGHYRNGILLAPVAAERVAELVADRAAVA
jgi:glycine oxidase